MLKLQDNAPANAQQLERLAGLDSAALEAILQADFEAPEDEQLDAGTVLYIANLLAERENQPHRDVAAAKADFYEHYLPRVVRDKKSAQGGFSHVFQRIGALAAVFLFFVMFAGTVTAYATGYNPVVQTYDLDKGERLSYSPETADLLEFLKKCDEQGRVPQWLPEGYKVDQNTLSYIMNNSKNYSLGFYRVAEEPPYKMERLFVNFSGSMTNSKYLISLYERGFGHIVLYQCNGIDFYIMGIDSRRTIFWQNDGLYCRVIGSLTMEEAKKIADSIY